MTGGSARSVGVRASAVRASAPTGGPGVSVGAGTSAWEKRGAGLLRGERVRGARWAGVRRGPSGRRWAGRVEANGLRKRKEVGWAGAGLTLVVGLFSISLFLILNQSNTFEFK